MGNTWRSRAAAIRRQDEAIDRTCIFVRYAMLGDLENLQLMLIKDKMDPNATDRFGMTALHWACYTGKLACIQELLRVGASTTAVDLNGRNALHHACRKDNDGVVRFLVQVEKMDPNAASENKDTPLHKAVKGNGVKSIEVLLQHGADPHLRNDQNRTPLEELDSSPGTIADDIQGDGAVSSAHANDELQALRHVVHTHTKSTAAVGSTTLIKKFSTSVVEFSGHRSSDASTTSSRTSSVHAISNTIGAPLAGATSAWVRVTGTSSTKNTVHAGDHNDSSATTPVEFAPLDFASLHAELNAAQPHSPLATPHSAMSIQPEQQQQQQMSDVPPAHTSLQHAGKRVIMALRVKQMPVEAKRELIRLLLQRTIQQRQDVSSGDVQITTESAIAGKSTSDVVVAPSSTLQQHKSPMRKLSSLPGN